MVKRYRGGVISATFPVPGGANSSGMYTVTQAVQFKKASQWPGSSDFTISPAVNGKTEWTLAVDGNLILTTPGEYTLTFSNALTKTVKMWGGAGMPASSSSSTSWGAGGAGGAAVGTVAFTAGQTYKFRVGDCGASGNASASAYGAGNGGGVASVGTAGSGGGYTGIFAGTSVSQGTAILMAGGGGGGASSRGDGLGGRRGTAGGGTSGQTIADLNAGPGTQSAGGGSAGSGATSGSALLGGNGSNGGAGGGGGYFGGGGGGAHGDGGYGGGGGSGYYSTLFVTSASLYTGTSNTPGNDQDSDRPTNAGNGGNAGTTPVAGAIIIKAV